VDAVYTKIRFLLMLCGNVGPQKSRYCLRALPILFYTFKTPVQRLRSPLCRLMGIQ